MRDIVVLEFIHNGEIIFLGTCSPEEKELRRYIVNTIIRFNLPPQSGIYAKFFSWKGAGLNIVPWLKETRCLA